MKCPNHLIFRLKSTNFSVHQMKEPQKRSLEDQEEPVKKVKVSEAIPEKVNTNESPSKLAAIDSSPFKTPVGSPSRKIATPTRESNITKETIKPSSPVKQSSPIATSPKNAAVTMPTSPKNTMPGSPKKIDPVTPEPRTEKESEVKEVKETLKESPKESLKESPKEPKESPKTSPKTPFSTPQKSFGGFSSFANSGGFAQFSKSESGFAALSQSKSALFSSTTDTPTKGLTSQVRKFQFEETEVEKKVTLEQQETVTGEENEKLIDSVFKSK
jgi:hypothetical protein